MEQIRKYNLEDFKKLLLNHFKDIYDLELLILKGHIITEFTINCYLENLSNSLDANFFKERYNHSLKIGMIEHFGKFGDRTLEIVKSLRLLNKIRKSYLRFPFLNKFITTEVTPLPLFKLSTTNNILSLFTIRYTCIIAI